MKNNRQKLFLIGLFVFFLVVLPIAVYLARTEQLFERRAAFGEVTLNLVPLTATKTVGEPLTIEVHATSGDKPVSAITVAINGNMGRFVIQSVTGAIGPNEAFTDLLYDKNVDPNSFTLLAKKPTANLSKGTFKVASFSVILIEPGAGTVTIDTAKSMAVGYNGQSEDVGLTVSAGTPVAFTATGTLCKILQCVEQGSITLTPNLRPDNTTYNVALTFPKGNQTATLYKIFSNSGGAVPADHSIANQVGVVVAASQDQQAFVDTNRGAGYPGTTNLHYDIDGYYACSVSPTPIPIPTSSPNQPVITYPTSPSTSSPTTTTSTSVTITWNPPTISGKTVQNYLLRIDDRGSTIEQPTWTDTCATINPGDVCLDNVTTTSYVLSGAIGHSYVMWLTAHYTDDTYSDVSVGRALTITAP